MTEYNDKEDRISATKWFKELDALAELDNLNFAVISMVELVTPNGSYERETARNVAVGIRRRIDYLHDSLRRLIRSKNNLPPEEPTSP